MFERDVMTLHKRVIDFKRFQMKHYPQVTEENDNRIKENFRTGAAAHSMRLYLKQ